MSRLRAAARELRGGSSMASSRSSVVQKPSFIGQRQPQAAARVNLVEFQVLRLEPGMIPVQAFAVAELTEQYSLVTQSRMPTSETGSVASPLSVRSQSSRMASVSASRPWKSCFAFR